MGYLASELGISFACYSLRQLKPLAANQISRSSSISVINLKWDHGFMAWDGVAFWWVWGGSQGRHCQGRLDSAVRRCLWHYDMSTCDNTPSHRYILYVYIIYGYYPPYMDALFMLWAVSIPLLLLIWGLCIHT